MDLNNLISTFWKDIFPDEVIYMSTYKLERQRKYPGLPLNYYYDPRNVSWEYRQKAMKAESVRLQRKAHNEKVREKYIKPQPPTGA